VLARYSAFFATRADSHAKPLVIQQRWGHEIGALQLQRDATNVKRGGNAAGVQSSQTRSMLLSLRDAGSSVPDQSILKKKASDESTLFLGRSRGGSCRIGPLKPRQLADAFKRASFLEMLT
jgi:hypothetical protein